MERFGTTIAAIGALLLGACASHPLEVYSEASPPVVLANIGDAGVRDLRAHYRAEVCGRLPAGAAACEDVLLRLPGEEDRLAPTGDDGLPGRYRIAFVPGFTAECLDRFARPFSDAQRALEAEGFGVDYFGVSGRGTSAENAELLAEHFDAADEDSRPFIVFAYSKGLPDTLEFALRHPQSAARIAAIVSVAGVANGSPLAADLGDFYRDWVASFPLPGCEVGSGDEIRDLRRDVRLEWWRDHRRSVGTPIFALVAAPRPGRVSPPLRAAWDRLAQVDPRNDGQVLWQDQITPGGYLLGYANADHWTVALAVSEAHPALSFAVHDDVPRAVLVRAAIEVVAKTLRTDRSP